MAIQTIVRARTRYVTGYGVAAVIVAAGGVTAALLLRSPAQERAPVQAKQIAATAAGAPVRDQWYLETPAATTAQRLFEQLRDGWYLDAPAATTLQAVSEQPRDRWYLDLSTAAGASRTAAPARDRWYLDGRN